jgi:hypothetical protein
MTGKAYVESRQAHLAGARVVKHTALSGIDEATMDEQKRKQRRAAELSALIEAGFIRVSEVSAIAANCCGCEVRTSSQTSQDIGERWVPAWFEAARRSFARRPDTHVSSPGGLPSPEFKIFVAQIADDPVERYMLVAEMLLEVPKQYLVTCAGLAAWLRNFRPQPPQSLEGS